MGDKWAILCEIMIDNGDFTGEFLIDHVPSWWLNGDLMRDERITGDFMGDKW